MKIRKTKRGFTIVELVIVIAVIGVLTAILVPTFINLTAKANKASDNSLVANLNTALKMQEGEATDKKNETMHDAVEDLDNYGYNLTNLVAKSSDDLLYSLEENRFYLSDAEQVKADLEAGKGYKYWHIQDNLSNPKGYSIYAGRNFSETTVPVTAGFDAGDKTTITSVTYDRSSATVGQEVVIRTNDMACDVTINAPKDVVRHYGEAQSIDVIAIKSTSYHEYGAAPFISVTAGRIVLEDSAQVEALHVESSSAILAIASTEALPEVTVEEGVTSFKVETTAKDSGETLTTSNVTVAANGSVTLDQQSTALSGNSVVETMEKEDAKGEAVANSDLVFQVNGSWAEVASTAKTALNTYVAAYNSNKLATYTDYTPEQIKELFPAVSAYFVEAGTIHIDIDSLNVAGVTLSSSRKTGLSIGRGNFIYAESFKIENGKLYLPLPIAAFELNNGGVLKINKTNVSLGTDLENQLEISVFGKNYNPISSLYSQNEDDEWLVPSDGNIAAVGFEGIANNDVYCSRKLVNKTDGKVSLSYGFSTVDGIKYNSAQYYGYVFYTPTNASFGSYGIYFFGANKTAVFNINYAEATAN